jgi:hypothetical protein
MASPEAFMASINSTEYLEDGTKLVVNAFKKDASPVTAGDTTWHETDHSIVAAYNDTLESVSINPGPGYLGVTRTSRTDVIAAAASKAMDHSGRGHDENIVHSHSSGQSLETAAGAARSIILNNIDGRNAVASELEHRKELTGFEVKEILRNVEDEKKNPTYEVELFILRANKKEKILFESKTENNKIKIPENKVFI